jgi:hypothetical protein
MISYNDFDFAIARWKARAGGAPQPAQPAASGTVQSEVPVATAPESPGGESGAVAEEAPATNSGLVMSESLLRTPTPVPEDPDQN